MSDYKELSKKLLDDRKITVYDYFNEIVCKDMYKTRCNELYKENLRLNNFNVYLLFFLVISVSLNISLLIVMCVW